VESLEDQSRRARRGRRLGQRGGAAVEFAIVLPIFCAIVFGIIDYGWYFYQRFAIAAAIRDGLRKGVTISQSVGSPGDCASVAIAQAKADLTNSAVDPAYVTFSTTTGDAYPTKTLTLTGIYTFKPLVNFVPLPTKPMTYSMTMMFELQQ
jgi:Flp pilus assembly protein TadG